MITLDRLLRENEQLFREQRPPSYGSGGLAPDYSGGDARSVIVRNHHFESWAGFAEYREALHRKNSPDALFEVAVDAIVTGDAVTLDRLLHKNPELIRARSTRVHHATLLHYVGSNGVEDFRQKTPTNIVRIAEVLLKAGAQVDAAADMYGGGSTTVGVVATSIHPFTAGVLEPLIALLLEHGAAVDGAGGRSIVNACLANGRPRGAELMAGHGARLDLQGAAGVGRLDLVRSFFNEDGTLKTSAMRAQMNNAFAWACQYGRTSVVDFLLQRGMQIDAKVTAAYLRQPVFVSDIASDPRWVKFRNLALQSGLRAAWSTPIMSHDGKVLGTFGMYYREVRQPGPRRGSVDRIRQPHCRNRHRARSIADGPEKGIRKDREIGRPTSADC